MEKIVPLKRDRVKCTSFMDNWFVYILKCEDGTFYTGITKDVEKRVKRHNAGLGAWYTRTRLPVKLVWYETAGSYSEALRRELSIKKLSKDKKEKLIS